MTVDSPRARQSFWAERWLRRFGFSPVDAAHMLDSRNAMLMSFSCGAVVFTEISGLHRYRVPAGTRLPCANTSVQERS